MISYWVMFEQMWHAMVLLVLHGIAGVLWNPPSQVLLHDIVPLEQYAQIAAGATLLLS